MKSILKKLIPTILILIFAMSLIGCGAKPEQTAKDFFNALKEQDIQKASKFVLDSSKEKLEFDSEEQKNTVKAIISKVDYTLGDINKSGDSATVNASITSVDLPKITGNLISDIFSETMSQVFAGEKNDEKKQEDIILKNMLNSINDPKCPKIKKDIKIKLVKKNKQWFIEPNEELGDAITGNFYSVLKKLGSE